MKPLVSLKVLDLTDGNPYIGSLFANYGAEVLKIEAPGKGDSIRYRGVVSGEGEGPYAAYYNRGKKSIALDITKPAGAEIVKKLAAGYDMIVFNVAEAKVAPYGLSYAELKAVNPKIVYGVLTPYGETGPWKDLPDYDLLVMARSGLLEKTGLPEKPTKMGFPLGYYYGSWHLTAGMMAAYLDVLDGNEGRKVSCSSWQAVASIDDTYAQCMQGLNTLPVRIGNGFPTTNPTDTFKCKNGWFALSIGSDDQWLSFVESAGMSDKWGEGTIYGHDPDRSLKHYFGDLDKQLWDFFATITIEEADQICRNAMVPGGPCNTVKELMGENDYVEARQMLIEIDDPKLGKHKQLGLAAKFLKNVSEDDNVIAPAPALGADTDAVLAALGVNADELKAAGVL